MGNETIRMKKREIMRVGTLERVKSGSLTRHEAAEIIGVTYRHCIRLLKRFKDEGIAALKHGNRGRRSNRAKTPEFREKVLQLFDDIYSMCGPTLAAEKIAEEGYVIDHETLRRWLIATGKWGKKRSRGEHRKKRERKADFGEMVQMDGSPHRWFGDDKEPTCLFDLVDDATSTAIGLMDKEETTEIAMRSLWWWINLHGIPRSIYVDRKNVFKAVREATIEEQLAGEQPLTAFGKACVKLDIEMIFANSPQAKGRVERKHGVYQDRFRIELALKGIKTIEGANELLRGGFCEHLNVKFAVQPLNDHDYHRPVPEGLDLRDVFCIEQTRVLQNDWTVRFEKKVFQVLKDNKPFPRPTEKIIIRIHLDGETNLIYKNVSLKFTVLDLSRYVRPLAYDKPGRPMITEREKRQSDATLPVRGGTGKSVSKIHPWRRWNRAVGEKVASK